MTSTMTSVMKTLESMNVTTTSELPEDTVEVLRYYHKFPFLLKIGLNLLFFVTLVLNVLVGVALFRARGLQTSLRVLLFNLSVGDAAGGLVNLYHFSFAILDYSFTIECLIRYGLVIELLAVTLFFMLLLSLDRVISLIYALRYESLVTNRRLWIATALAWTFSLVLPIAGLAPVDMNSKYCIFQLFMPQYSFIVYGLGCLMVICLIVSLNLYTLRKSLLFIKYIPSAMTVASIESRGNSRNYKAIVTTITVIIPFLILNIPQYALFLLFAFIPELRESLYGLIAISVGLGLVTFNSVLNPFIYVYRCNEVREEVRRTFCLHRFVVH